MRATQQETNPTSHLHSKPAETKPYKGPESYRVEDTDLFFGRNVEAEQVIAKILSSRFTLVHAKSGAGKTSLLNAKVIPGLEARGTLAFRVLPANDPIESIRVTTLQNVLPPPRAELFALERACQALSLPGEDLRLDDFLNRFDDLPFRDARRRTLAAPFEMAPATGAASFPTLSGLGPLNPMFSRLLRSTIDSDEFAEHLGALRDDANDSEVRKFPIDGETRVSGLRALLSDPGLARAHTRMVEQLYVPVPDLWDFFENLVHTYGRRRSRFMLVLILDQFEELFTRFVDPGPGSAPREAGMPEWRLRPQLFAQFETLYSKSLPLETAERGETGALASAEPRADGNPLPIRYVVSMREEYIAQLGAFQKIVGNLDRYSYHLALLEREEAVHAIQEPAALFGYTYSPDCYAKIVAQLTKEDLYVEPSHLQIVCEKLWNERGRELATRGSPSGDRTDKPTIEAKTFDDLGGASGILSSFFNDFLQDVEPDSRAEMLEMLERLVTTSGTRNILERGALINAAFRDPDRRARLLDMLVNRTIVRVERRLNGYFVEITHEFLIRPVLDAIQEQVTKHPALTRFRLAIKTLEAFEQSASTGSWNRQVLQEQDFLTLHENRGRLVWNVSTRELMLKSAIKYEVAKDILLVWLKELPEEAGSEDVGLVQASLSAGAPDRILNLDELNAVNRARHSLVLSPYQIDLVLRSELFWATDSERNDVIYWGKRASMYES
jgi:hypothetical protein